MGFIRSGGVVIVSILLFFALFFSGLFLTLNGSLNYNNVESHVGPYLKNITGNVYVLNDSVVNNAINKTYYQNYNCSMIDCIKTNQITYLYSAQAKNYWASKARLFLLISLALFIFLFLLVSKKSSAFITAGGVTILASLPFNKMNWVYKIIPAGNFKSLVDMFFSASHNVFLSMLFIGIGILILGIILTVIRMGLSFNKFLDKFRKEKEPENEENNEDSEEKQPEETEEVTEEDQKKYSLNDVKKIVKDEVEKVSKKKSKKEKK